VLQAGDELSFGFEAADELRVVGVAGQDDLDRHFTLDEGLNGAVDHAEAAFTHAVAEFEAADGAAGEVFETDLLGCRGRGGQGLGGGGLEGGSAGQAYEGGAFFEGDLERGGQAFGDLDRGAQGIVFDLADGDGGAGHAAGEFSLGQVEGLAVLLDDAPK
jgi:hypothetical protein